MRITKSTLVLHALGEEYSNSVIGPSLPVLKPLGESRVDHSNNASRMRVEEGHWEFHASTEYDDVDAAEFPTVVGLNTASQEVAFQTWLMSLATTPGASFCCCYAGASSVQCGRWFLPNAAAKPTTSVAMP
jgi:hypothetical protein